MDGEGKAPGAAEKFDDAKGRLRAAAEGPATHTKTPASYHVFLMENSAAADARDIPPIWSQITAQPVTAPNRKQAIIAATKAMTLEEVDGETFWAVPADQFQPIKRKPRQEVIDDWE
jgi:hypothetical protein